MALARTIETTFTGELLEEQKVCSKPITTDDDGFPLAHCQRPRHDGPCSGDGGLEGYSTISVQDFGILCERVERLTTIDRLDIDTEGHIAERLSSGTYQLRNFRDSSRTQHDTAAGLVMAWLESA